MKRTSNEELLQVPRNSLAWHLAAQLFPPPVGRWRLHCCVDLQDMTMSSTHPTGEELLGGRTAVSDPQWP